MNPYDFMENEQLSPSSNRGAQNTCEGRLIAVVDWLQVTFKMEKDFLKIIDLLGLENSYFLEGSGQYGYKKSMVNNGIFIFYDGTDSMGVHLQITGTGCRYLEAVTENFSWYEFFYELGLHEINVTRLDIALDDFNKMLSIPTLKRKIKKGECISKFKESRFIETINLAEGTSKGDTIYFGQPTSRIQIRFYEKNHEMRNKGIMHDIEHWNRYEIQLRKERAETVFNMIALNNNDDFKDTVKGILSGYIRFTNRDNNKNKSRWKTYGKWNKFIGEVEKIKLTESKVEKDIFDSYEWIKKQAAPTLAMLLEAEITNLDEIIKDGKTRLKDIHKNKINEFKLLEKNIKM